MSGVRTIGGAAIIGITFLSFNVYMMRLDRSNRRALQDASRQIPSHRHHRKTVAQMIIESGGDVESSIELIKPVPEDRSPTVYLVDVFLKGKKIPSKITEVSTIYGVDYALSLAYNEVGAEMGSIGFQCKVREK